MKAPTGTVEPHAGLLRQPPSDQLIYKVMKVEHLLASVVGRYLHFNRVDRYKDFPGADAHDGEQLPADNDGNVAARFAKAPDYSVADYYDQSRSRTYACSFSLENSSYIWEHYAQGSARGRTCVVFNFGKLKALLNATFAPGNAVLQYRGQMCRQIFSINYGLVDYIDWDRHRANAEHLPNPIQYTYLKAAAFKAERELRISVSTIGIGRFQLADGSELEFLADLQVPLDFHLALNTGAITGLECGREVDFELLSRDLKTLGVEAIVRGS